MNELDILHVVVSRLEAAGIAYMVTGSIAATIFGPPRMTRDVDLVIELEPIQGADIIQALFAADFLSDADSIRNAIRDRGMFNLIHREEVIKVDFIVRKNTPYREMEFQRRQKTLLGGEPVWVATPEDLILSKLLWAKPSHSEVQMRDVRGLVGSGRRLDRPYIDRWAAELGIMDQWQEVQTP